MRFKVAISQQKGQAKKEIEEIVGRKPKNLKCSIYKITVTNRKFLSLKEIPATGWKFLS